MSRLTKDSDFSSKRLVVTASGPETEPKAVHLADHLKAEFCRCAEDLPEDVLVLSARSEGLTLSYGSLSMKGDLSDMLPRVRKENLNRELLVKAAGLNRMANQEKELLAVDATAGMGEDALLLAASGCFVKLYEKDPVIAALLKDSLKRAAKIPELQEIVSRMELTEGDSLKELSSLPEKPYVILLDPMFPERRKSALVGKKFQLLHYLECPCEEEEKLLDAAIQAGPERIVIKRPLKGPYLGGIKPSFTMEGKAIRYDCLLQPQRTGGIKER